MPLHSVPLFKYRRQSFSSDKARLLTKPESLTAVHSVVGSWSSRTYGASPSTTAGSLTRSPSQFTFLKSPRNVDDFSFGIPQWIDLSYWSSETKTKSVQMSKREGARQYLDARYARPFEPRLRMYELQMMGVMETGLANISVPYLTEDTQRRGYRVFGRIDPNEGRLPEPLSRSHQNAVNHKKRTPTLETQHKGLLSVQAKQQGDLYDRMDAYDSILFKAHAKTQRQGNTKSSKKLNSDHGGTLVHKDMSQNGAEITIHGTSTTNNNSRPSAITKPDKHSSPVKSTLVPQNPKQKSGPSTPASRISRSISFALRGLAPPPRAVASTEINVQNVGAEPSAKAVTPGRAFTEVSSGLKSPSIIDFNLRPRPSVESENSDRSDSGHSGGDSTPSRPIKIGTPQLRAQNQNRDPNESLESITSATVTSKTSRDAYSGTQARLRDVDEDDKLSRNSKAPKERAAVHDAAELSPWIRRVNPSNPTNTQPRTTPWVGRWQHLYPRPQRASGMKWRSLCTPASVPLTTEEFPTKEELDTLFDQRSYMVSQDVSKELSEIPRCRESFVHEMLGLRFAHGYQLVVGPALANAGFVQTKSYLVFMDLAKLVNDGNCIFMSMGNSIQRISFANSTEVEVTKFIRKAPKYESSTPQSTTYRPSIRTILSSGYTTKIMRHAGFSEEYPWQMADQYLAGRVDSPANAIEKLRFWRARFVLIPVETPASARRPVQAMSEDNEEEIHLLGIRALTQMWQRYRHIPPEGPKFKPMIGRRKDPNPLEINFQTLNPSEVVATELDKFSAAEDAGEGRSTQLLPESEMLDRSNCSLSQLAQIMQSDDTGIDILTRRWHLQLHFHCFKGDDFTDWLTLNFKDIDTREEAVEFGNELMQHGLFQHANKRHNFKDGNYFYQIDAEYRTPRPESKSSWFPTSRRSDRSIPSTPATEIPPKDSPLGSRTRSASSSINEGHEAPISAPPKSSAEKKRMSIALSKVMRLDVDHRKRSSRPEIINLHYDRLHNPENCYHLELSWMNVTSKLVEDAIVTWATQGEKYGLKLVEVPIAEVSSISDYEPFRAPSRVTISVPPPKSSIAAANGNTYFTSTSFTPQTPPKLDPLLYQKALLRKFNFVLDLEAASDFPSDVDVEYSWGKLEYRYSQFVHRSGVILAQITEEGDFLLLANRLYNTRSAATNDSTRKFDAKKDLHNSRAPAFPPTSVSGIAGLNVPQPSPQASPMVRASSDVLGSKAALATSGMATYITPEQIFWDLEEFCNDAVKLEAFYKEVAAAPPSIPRRSSSTSSSALKPVRDLEMSIPELILPASLAPTMSPISGSGLRKGRKLSPNLSEVGKESPRRKPTD